MLFILEISISTSPDESFYVFENVLDLLIKGDKLNDGKGCFYFLTEKHWILDGGYM